MPVMRLPECSGTVVIHRDNSVTCTTGGCPRHLPRGTWFALHSAFRRCAMVAPEGCPECRFDQPRSTPRLG